MSRRQSYLSPLAKQDLLHYVAVNGEGFKNYSAYCDLRGFHKFTAGYLHLWVNRNRDTIRLIRSQHLHEVRQTSIMERNQRLAFLENAVNRVEALIVAALADPDAAPDGILRMMEQQRKLLEAVAKERGEWMAKEADSSPMDDIQAKLMERMTRALPAGSFVEGEVRELVE